jgi:hypothetical protein
MCQNIALEARKLHEAGEPIEVIRERIRKKHSRH